MHIIGKPADQVQTQSTNRAVGSAERGVRRCPCERVEWWPVISHNHFDHAVSTPNGNLRDGAGPGGTAVRQDVCEHFVEYDEQVASDAVGDARAARHVREGRKRLRHVVVDWLDCPLKNQHM